MTILQLKYVLALAKAKSMREAASRLYVSQPALSSTIRELEEELNIRIFERNNKGISITAEGIEFLTYAKQAVSQYEVIEDRYIDKWKNKKHFSVSMQHYVFALRAFINTIKQYDEAEYSYSVNETRTDDVLNDVRDMKSEVGIISFSADNEKIVKKLFREYQLTFVPIMIKSTYVYLWKTHPLANYEKLSLKDLEEYPCISFDQHSENEYYLTEEALSGYEFKRHIKSNDRATSAELMEALNGYSIGTGNMTESTALREDFVSIKLEEEDPLTIGYIVRANQDLSDMGKTYVAELLKYNEPA